MRCTIAASLQMSDEPLFICEIIEVGLFGNNCLMSLFVFGSAPMFELVAGVSRQFPACIGVDQVVDALM